jgi:hypothetical protein
MTRGKLYSLVVVTTVFSKRRKNKNTAIPKI